MYNRLTLVDGFLHKDARTKILNDHKHLTGFTPRNIYRYLPSDNPNIPRRVVTPRHKTSITNTNNDGTHSNTEPDNKSANNNNEADSQAILTDEHHEKSIAERDANYNGLSNTQLMVLIRQRDEQIIDLHEKDTQNINKITELQAALAETSFKTADQMPKTEVKEVGVDLEKFGALLFAAIRNRKKRCSIQIDQTGNAIGLRTAAEEINEVEGPNE